MANTATTTGPQRLLGTGPAVNYLTENKGLKSWLLTLDHKRIGLMYLWGTLFAFFLAGVAALFVRLELWTPNQDFAWMDAEMYNRFFTFHGAVMVFLFIIPSIPGALGNFVIPLMLGAKDVAFPRLNLFSFYLYLAGTLMALSTLFWGGVDTGWTFYTPYSTTTGGPVTLMAMAVFTLGFSSIFTGLNFVATVHKLRAPGMTWFQLPLFVWAMYSTALIQVLATPVLGITIVLMAIERAFHIGLFDPRLGGDPVLFQHFFWFYSHPAVYIMILPGMAIISELIPTFSKKTIFGYRAIAFSSVSIAFIGFLVWGHHMFTSGQSELAGAIFSFITFLVAIPSGVKIWNWLATMYQGSISLNTPMLYAISFLLLFAIGGLTGLHLGALATDIHLHDTYFVVAHFHYVMMGGTVIAYIGGLFYWWPKMFGKMYNERMGQLGCLLVFIGFNVTFMNQFMMGSQGMPRRYFTYLPEFQRYHQGSTIGSWILGLGLLIAAITLMAPLFRKKEYDAPDNPWGARTMEWETTSPPITHNFETQPVLRHGPYDFRVEPTPATVAGGRHQ